MFKEIKLNDVAVFLLSISFLINSITIYFLGSKIRDIKRRIIISERLMGNHLEQINYEDQK